MKQNKFPAGWNAARVKKLLDYYESQSEEEALADDEAAFEAARQTVMVNPTELVPAVDELIAKHKALVYPVDSENTTTIDPDIHPGREMDRDIRPQRFRPTTGRMSSPIARPAEKRERMSRAIMQSFSEQLDKRIYSGLKGSREAK